LQEYEGCRQKYPHKANLIIIIFDINQKDRVIVKILL